MSQDYYALKATIYAVMTVSAATWCAVFVALKISWLSAITGCVTGCALAGLIRASAEEIKTQEDKEVKK